jgi:hypothetical protein
LSIDKNAQFKVTDSKLHTVSHAEVSVTYKEKKEEFPDNMSLQQGKAVLR